MITLKRLYYKIFPHYQILERRLVAYPEAHRLIKDSYKSPEQDRWVLDNEYEDINSLFAFVYLCRKKRILI